MDDMRVIAGSGSPKLAQNICQYLGISLGKSETMRFSERTLQRRLEELGTNFREVVDSVRAELSWHHVTSSRLRISQIATMLGYETQSAFGRAFKRWYGKSPQGARDDASGHLLRSDL